MATPKLRAKLPLLILLLSLLTAEGARKIWLKNTNWMNSQNWDRGSLPCSKQVVSFQEKPKPYAVFVQSDVTVGELRLARDLEIVFADDLKVNFGAFLDDPYCKAGENRFVGGEPEDWLNPRNWRVEEDENLVPKPDDSSGSDDTDGFPVLHAEVVPCKHDVVIFPENATYLVSARADNKKEIKAKQLEFTGMVYKSSKDLGDFLSTENGQMQFKMERTGSRIEEGIDVSGRDCEDNSGCYCGNLEHMKKICGLVGDSCPPVTCSDPVTPVGSCCPMCGAVLTMSIDAIFDVMSFQDRLVDGGEDAMLSKHTYPGRVRGRVSKLDDGRIQLVLVDNVPGVDSGMAAGKVGQHIEAVINEDIAIYHTYGFDHIDPLQKSKRGPVAGQAGGSGSNLLVYIAAGAGGGGALFIGVLVFLFIWVKKRRAGPKDAQDSGGQKQAGPGPGPAAPGAAGPSTAGQAGGGAGPSRPGPPADKGFENPVYDNPIKDNPLYADIPDDP